jgi:2-oxoisovalerate dehydrogenase E1 component
MAASLDLPLLFFIEDNGWGISVPGELQTPGGNIVENLKGFKCLRTFEADGWDPQDALEKVRAAVKHVRSGKGPSLLRMRVARLLGHTFVDDQAYKTAEQRQLDAQRDPLEHLKAYMLEHGYAQQQIDRLEMDIRREIHQAAVEAEQRPNPTAEEIQRYVFFDRQPPDQGGLRPEGAQLPLEYGEPKPEGTRIGLLEAMRKTLSAEMERNPRILVFGEDVGVKGGVHGATAGMQKRFGEPRVFDTSLSEEGIMGRSTGMALAGLLPVPEIQFRKYADPAHEQIDDLGTLRWRTANHFAAPVIVRIPVGYGKKTGDPWHSVTGEAVYAHMIGWRIAFPSNAQDAAGLMRTALRSDDPTFFFEHRALLDTPEGRRPYPGDDYCLPFGKASRVLDGDELLVVTWGEMVYRCLEAAKGFEGRVRLLDLRTISPWDREQVLEGAKELGKVLIVHEDGITAGFGAEIAAVVAGEAFEWLDAPVKRMAVPDIPIPYSLPAMEAVLPNAESIRAKMDWLLSY